MGTLKRQAVNGVLWRIVETGGRQLIQLVISMVLARLIMPESFGAIAMLTIFTAIANTFVDSGFSTAIIRKTDRTQTDCSTVFWFNIVVALVCYALIFAISPWVARFYDMPVLCPVLRVTALSIVIGSFAGLQRSLITAAMNFKALAKLNIIALTISGIVGMAMAYKGFEVWALVAQSLVSSAVGTALLWYYSKWRPSFEFSRRSFREFFGFGSKLLASALLDQIFTNLYGVVIGKVFRASDLAFYNRANSLSMLASSTPTTVLQSVTFPTLCKLQDNDEALRLNYRRIIRLSAFIVFPFSLGLGAAAYPAVNVLFSETWIQAAALLEIIVLGNMWYPIHAINLNLLQVKGRSDLFFRLEVIKKINTVLMLCVTVPLGLKAICWGGLYTSVVALFINTHYTGKLLGLGILEQCRDFRGSLLLSAAMFGVVRVVAILLGNGILSLCACVAAGVAFYLAGAWLFRMPELKELRNLRK